MRGGEFRICPACQTRNKSKWEFCVRCGEPLADVTIATSAPPAEAASQGGLAVERAYDEGSPAAFVFTLGFVVFVGAAVTVWALRRPVEKGPDPGIFAASSLPPAPVAKLPPTPDTGEVSFQAGRRLLGAGKAAEAVALLAQAVGADPTNALYHSVYAKALWATGSKDQALAEFSRAAQLAPSTAEYRVGLAGALTRAGRTDEAAQEYRQILIFDPGNADALKGLGRLLVQKGDPKEAAGALERASELRPNDLGPKQDLAYALEGADPEKAARLYREILAALPQAAISRGRLGEVLYTQGKVEDAIAVVQEGVAQDPKSPILRRDLGSLLERAGRVQEAAAAYREYAQLAPDATDAKALAERADVLEQEGAPGPS